MSLDLLYRMLLNEANLNDIYQKYYKDINYDMFLKIIAADPKTNIQKNKVGPYSKVLLNIFRKNNLRLEDLPKATEYLDVIYRRNIPVSINQIQDLSDLYVLVQKYIAQESGSLKDVIAALGLNEYEILLDGDKWVIYTPKTEKAACYLGVNTEWCTTWGKHSLNPKHRDRQNRFNDYKNDKLYIIIDKNNESNKFQFHFPSNQFMNPADSKINIGNFLDDEIEIKRFFYPSLFNENLEPSEKEIVRMDYLNDSDILKLVKKMVGNTTNKLVIAYMTNNKEEVERLTNNENANLIEDGKITFAINKAFLELNDLSNLYHSFKHQLTHGGYEPDPDIDKYELKEIKTKFFNEYFNKNKDKIYKSRLIKDFETFENLYLDVFLKYDLIEDKINKIYYETSSQNYDNSVKEAMNEIEKYIEFGSYLGGEDPYVKAGFFLKFLIDTETETIEDVNDTINDYINHYNIGTEWDSYEFDYYGEIPSYDDIEYEIDNFFDNIFENDDETDCVKTREELLNMLNKVLKSEHEIENEIAYLKVYPETLDCEKKTIKVDFRNKETNEKFSGNIQVSSIPNYVNNYQLFESIINFKRFI
jgi:hypothetical protein